MAVLPKTEHHQVKDRRLTGTHLLDGSLKRGRAVLWRRKTHRRDGMEGRMASRGLVKEGLTQHPGVARGIVSIDPALIAEKDIDALPGQVLLTEKAIGHRGGAATREGELCPIPLIEGEVEIGRDRLGRHPRQVLGIPGPFNPIGGHRPDLNRAIRCGKCPLDPHADRCGSRSNPAWPAPGSGEDGPCDSC